MADPLVSFSGWLINGGDVMALPGGAWVPGDTHIAHFRITNPSTNTATFAVAVDCAIVGPDGSQWGVGTTTGGNAPLVAPGYYVDLYANVTILGYHSGTGVLQGQLHYIPQVAGSGQIDVPFNTGETVTMQPPSGGGGTGSAPTVAFAGWES